MSDPALFVLTSDTHAGATTGPMRKPVEHDDGPVTHPGRLQLELADKIERACAWAANQARKRGSAGADTQSSVPVYVLHNGDLTEGIHHRSHQSIMAELMEPQIETAVDLLTIYAEALSPKAWFFTRGTEPHVGKAGTYEEVCAKRLRDLGQNVVASPETGHLTSWYWEIEAGGHTIWAAHHGKIGRLPHTKGSQAALFAAHTFLQESVDNFRRKQRGEEERPIPRLIIGSHHHQKADSGPHLPTRTIQLPCWTWRNSFAHKVAAFSREDIGLALAYLDPDMDAPEVLWWTYEAPRNNRIVL